MNYPVYCVSNALVCDGKRNCPFDGKDEDSSICTIDETYEKVEFGLSNNPHLGRGWEFLASEFLKKLGSKDGGSFKRTETSSSTEKPTVLWTDDGSLSRELNSLSAARLYIRHQNCYNCLHFYFQILEIQKVFQMY